jgi:IS5 family transposase
MSIHYPTDSSLLWDSFRTLARLMKAIRAELGAVGLDHRFHTKKVKKLASLISRNGGSSSTSKQRKVKQTYRILIDRVHWIHQVARKVVETLGGCGLLEIKELRHYLPLVERIRDQAQKRIFAGVKVPAEEKIDSLFEEHTELIKRGKAGKPVEFGHKILIGQCGEKLITHDEVWPQRREDQELLEGCLLAHQKLFEQSPTLLAADKGFYQSRDQLQKLAQEIQVVSIAKKGSRTPEEKKREESEAFKEGQRFRAGSEGSISVLKRAYKLKKCLFKGYKNFAVSVGCAVFCHNLVLLTQL